MPVYATQLERTSTGVTPASIQDPRDSLVLHGVSFADTGASTAQCLVEGLEQDGTTWRNLIEFDAFGTVNFPRPLGLFRQFRITFGGTAGRCILHKGDD